MAKPIDEDTAQQILDELRQLREQQHQPTARTLTDADVDALCDALLSKLFKRLAKVAPALCSAAEAPLTKRRREPSAEAFAAARRHFAKHGK